MPKQQFKEESRACRINKLQTFLTMSQALNFKFSTLKMVVNQVSYSISKTKLIMKGFIIHAKKSNLNRNREHAALKSYNLQTFLTMFYFPV